MKPIRAVLQRLGCPRRARPRRAALEVQRRRVLLRLAVNVLRHRRPRRSNIPVGSQRMPLRFREAGAQRKFCFSYFLQRNRDVEEPLPCNPYCLPKKRAATIQRDQA